MTMAGGTRIMVLGVGNPDRGDDGVGPAVIEALDGRLPAAVDARVSGGDFLNLINDWAEFDGLIVIDAAASLGAPGRVHRFDARSGDMPLPAQPASSHAFGLPEAIALARSLDQAPAQIIVFAVEGESFATGSGLSAPVRAATGELVDEVLRELQRLVQEVEPQDA